MLAAGLLAKKAVERGLKVPPHVKTSIAPGSRIASDYFAANRLQESLDALGFETVAEAILMAACPCIIMSARKMRPP